MTSCVQAELYEGRGQVYLAVRSADGSLGAWEPIAEARTLEITQTQDWEDVYSRCDRNSGQIARLLRQTDYEVSLDTLDMSLATIAKGVYGAIASVTSASVVGEAHAFEAVGASIALVHPFKTSAVVVKQGSEVVDADNYVVDADHGVITLVGATGLTGPAPYAVTVDYSHGDYEKVEAAVNGITNYALRFDGISIADNRPVQVTMHNMAMSMSATLGFITDEVGSLTLSGKLLADFTKGAGKSAFYTIAKGKSVV